MLTRWIAEGRVLLEAADAVAVDEYDGTKLGREAAYGYLKHDGAKKSGVLFLHWKTILKPTYLAMLTADWPEAKVKIAAAIPRTWADRLFSAVHNQFDSDWNDGEPYANNDPTTVWAPDARTWWADFTGRLKALTIEVSDILVSPKSGLPGFKITTHPPLGSLPRYTGKSMKPVL